jgi:penicillin-binding protein 1C
MAEALEERLPDRRRAMPFRAPHLAGLLARRAPGGATVTTAIDGPLQDRLETLARDEARWFGDGASLAIVVVENRGRAVRAWVGGHDFFGTAGQIDLTRARRSPGSTLKPFAYGIGFDELAAHPRTLIDDAPLIFPGYAPRNFDRLFHGVVTIEEALRQSLNVPAVALVDRIGAERFTAALRHAGAHLAFGRRGQRAGLPVVLGGVGISLADLVMLYAAVADDGRSLPLRLTNDTPERSPVTLMSAQSARDLARILAGAPRPSAMAAASAQDGTRRVAFKTGTSYGFRDAWAIGFGRSHTIGVWVGRADGTPRPGAYGRIAAAPILFKVLDRLPGFVELAESELVEAEQAPVGLKRFRPAAATLSARRHTDEAGPRIVFPPDGAEIELDRDDDALPAELMLSAEGGRRPLRWVVNGLPLVDDGTAPAVAWRPAGEGFARIVVIDAADRAAVATVRLR